MGDCSKLDRREEAAVSKRLNEGCVWEAKEWFPAGDVEKGVDGVLGVEMERP